MGFDLIMRMQTVITIVTGVLTVVYIVLVGRQDPLASGVGDPGRLGARRSSARWCS